MSAFLRQTRKAMGVAVVGLAAWLDGVLGGPDEITTGEWKELIALAVLVLACYGLTNEPKPEPVPTAADFDVP